MGFGISAVRSVLHPTAWRSKFIANGDSMVSGLDGVGTLSAFPTTLQTLLPDSANAIYNVAEGGRTVQHTLDDFSTDVAPLLPISTGQPAIFLLYIGNNDFDTTDALTIYNVTKTIWAQARAGGAKVICIPNLPNASRAPGTDYDNHRLDYNDLLFDSIDSVDLIINPMEYFGTVPNNTMNWGAAAGAGAGHFTDLGAQTFGKIIYERVNAASILA